MRNPASLPYFVRTGNQNKQIWSTILARKRLYCFYCKNFLSCMYFRGGYGEVKFSEEILLRCLSAEIWAVMTQNWENWEITQSGWLDPLYHYMNDMTSICWKISLFVKYVQNHIENELNMSKQRWIKSSCVLCKLVQLIPIIWHTKLFGQCYDKNLLLLLLFLSFFKFWWLAV